MSSQRERRWRRILDDEQRWKLSLLRSYVRKHGWSKLRQATVVSPGVKLGRWVSGCRRRYLAGTLQPFLATGLERIPGWSWDPLRDRYTRNIDILRRFIRRHGWDALRADTNVDGMLVSKWCATRREDYHRGELDTWVRRALEGIPGWSWQPRTDRNWKQLQRFRRLVDTFGIAAARDHAQVRKWAQRVRNLRRRGKLPAWLASELEAIDGWSWHPRADQASKTLSLLKRFVAANGWDALHRDTMCDGFRLGLWFYNQRAERKNGTLSKAMAKKLQSIPGWSWGSRRHLRVVRKRS
jgi:hypothetical protein